MGSITNSFSYYTTDLLPKAPSLHPLLPPPLPALAQVEQTIALFA